MSAATVFLWRREAGVKRDVVCEVCQWLPGVVVDYCACERAEVDLERDGHLVWRRMDDGPGQWSREVHCCCCGALVLQEKR
jgi:hypothetical protein